MPLIKCPDCNKQVSDQADACPFCGYPFEKLRQAKINAEKAEIELQQLQEKKIQEERDRQNRTCTDCIHYFKDSSEETCTYFDKTFLFMSKSKAKTCNGYYFSQQNHDRYANKCYLTTACCEYYGKADNCTELTVLRNFRDNVLLTNANGKKLVEEYYQTAPDIVRVLKQKNDQENFTYIYNIIQKCVKEIQNKNYDVAVEDYKNMVFELKKKLN